MKDPKKSGRVTDDPSAVHDEIRDLFRGIEDLDRPSGDGEDEDVLELEEVVDDGEEGLADLPDLDEDLADLEGADLEGLDGVEPSVEEPEADESLFDDAEVTVELAPPARGDERPREPLVQTALDEDEALEDDLSLEDELTSEEDLGEPEEDLEFPEKDDIMKPRPAFPEGLEGEASEAAPTADDAVRVAASEPEPDKEPVETEVWDVDMELQELLKTAAGRDVETAGEAEGPEELTDKSAQQAEPAPAEEGRFEMTAPLHEPVRSGLEAFRTHREDAAMERAVSNGDLGVLEAAIVGAMASAAALGPEAEDVRPMTSTERAEEAMMEERPAMFQPIVEVLEKRLTARVQAMVQKAVQEQLPGIVRRVLQEEIERLSKSLG